jgi:transcriptional regulator with GAF, ATPase, and Fis domain
MKRDERTRTEAKPRGDDDDGRPRPGLILVWADGAPVHRVVELGGRAIIIGRGGDVFAPLDDPMLSRRHVAVSLEGELVAVEDLGSRNGTSLDGEVIRGRREVVAPRVLRAGGAVFLFLADVRPQLAGVDVGDVRIAGPALRRVEASTARAAARSSILHVTGESGSGKELTARIFHERGPFPRGPFVAVNCAAIPEGVAERLLFGAQRGAYSGASDAPGYLEAAQHGTLFLDEIGELSLSVQAKLLRALQAREVLPLGAAKAQPIDIRLCTATHRDLRAEVAAGRLREDLYFRIARPTVAVPPLRERREEIGWHVARAVRSVDAGLSAHPSLVEACLLRQWPGNIRELHAEVCAAALECGTAGIVGVENLAATAGQPIVGAAAETPPPSVARTSVAKRGRLETPDRATLEALLRKYDGVVLRVAQELGCSRRQIGRWSEKLGIDRALFRSR